MEPEPKITQHRLYWPVIPSDFPLGYVLAPELDDNDLPTGHQMYVKQRWPHDQALWEMGCFKPGCEAKRTSVLNTSDLLAIMKKGLIIGKYQDGLIITQG